MTETTTAAPRCPLGASFDTHEAHARDPYPFYARARADEPVF